MKKLIITGATSMLGSAVIRSSLKHNVEAIYAIVRKGTPNINNIPMDSRIHIIECDCDDYDTLPDMIKERCDVFYHFAWAHSKTESRARYFDVEVGYKNIGQTLKALDAASYLGCKSFVGAGSQAEYGNRRELIQSPEDPSDPVTAYAIAKDCARRLCMLKAKEYGINVQWVRIFSVYGPHDRKNTLISSILPKLMNGDDIFLTDCLQKWDFLYEDDAGEGLYFVGKKDNIGSNIYCLGSGESKQLKEFVEKMKSIVNSKSIINYGIIPHSDADIMNLHADISKLKNLTGWVGPQFSFEEGIQTLISIAVENPLIPKPNSNNCKH